MPVPPGPTFTVSEAFGAIQRVGLLGDFDGGTWVRHVVDLFGPEAAARPLFVGQILEVVFRARRESEDLEHTHGHSARLEGLFLPRDMNEDDETDILASISALAAHFGVDGVEVDEPHDIERVFVGLGRAFARTTVRQRVFLVGVSEPLILIREEFEPIGPFSPAVRFELQGA